MSKRGLLDGPEVYCLKHHALRQFSLHGEVEPACFSGKLQKKVLASAEADNDLTTDALMLFRVSNLDKVSEEPQELDETELLEWWKKQLQRD